MGGSASISYNSRAFPPSIQLLELIAKELEKVHPVIMEGQYRLADENLESPSLPVIRVLQLLVLSVLSMFEGVFVPAITRLSVQEDKITLAWEGGSTDVFELGKIDPPFLRFFGYLQRRMWKKKRSDTFSLGLIQDLVRSLVGYTQILNICNDRAQFILQDPKNISKILDDGCPEDILFMIISALPVGQLNRLFLFLYTFFPDNLEIRMPDGHLVNVSALFQSPSVDPLFLLEKTRVYLRLLSHHDLPIIRIITQTKTILYLRDLVKNETIATQIKTVVFGIRESQILTRMRLYLMMVEILGKVM